MRYPALFCCSLLLLPASAIASHLTEAQVAAMEARCQAAREEKLLPEKEQVLDDCLAEGKEQDLDCLDKAVQEGEMRKIGTNYRVGKYYDLPECVEAYRARKHYQVNPNLRDRD